MKEKIFEGYKELEKYVGEEPAMSNVKFVIALLDDTNERWETQFKAFRADSDAKFSSLEHSIHTMQTTLFILLAILPIVVALVAFLKS